MIRGNWLRLQALILLVLVSSGCNLAGGIFKAGFTIGIIVVVLVLVLITFLVTKMRR